MIRFVSHVPNRLFQPLVLFAFLGMLVTGAPFVGCSGEVTFSQSGCEDCPDRCIREGNKGKCVNCLTDAQCQSATSPTRKCIENKCVCGTSQDCPNGQTCAGTGGCVDCLENKDCTSKERPICIEKTCVPCEAGATRKCTPDGLVPCVTGLQTCKQSGSWGACEGSISCQPGERCINQQCYLKCDEPPLCKAGEKRCTTDPGVAPGKFKECKINVVQCYEFEESEQFCGSNEVCEKGECKPKP